MARSRKGGNRVVVQISDENFLAMTAALTPPGETKPVFGEQSAFFNRLLDEWRARRALELSQPKESQP